MVYSLPHICWGDCSLGSHVYTPAGNLWQVGLCYAGVHVRCRGSQTQGLGFGIWV